MKKIFLGLLVFSLFACEGFVLDETKAQAAAEQMLTLIQNKEFEKTSDLYDASFNASDPLESRIKKFETIEEATGERQGFELLEKEVYELDGRSIASFTYLIKCKNTNLKETLIVGLEEGKHVVIRHTTTNKDL